MRNGRLLGLVAFLWLFLVAPLTGTTDPAHEERLRRLDLRARAFAQALEKMVARCTKCAGHGRLRRQGQTWTCPKCKGTGNQVVALWHEKVHWTMRSKAYRDGAGKRIEVLRKHREAMRRRARRTAMGTFDHVEMIDDTHGIAWHRNPDGTWGRFRWVHAEPEGWAWYHADYDGPWPESHADFGSPHARPEDYIRSTYLEKTDRTEVATKPLPVGDGLTLWFVFRHTGKRCTKSPPTVETRVTLTRPATAPVPTDGLTLFADGRRVAVEGCTPSRETQGSRTSTRWTTTIDLARFVRLAHASNVEGWVGASTHLRISTAQRRVLRHLARLATQGCRPQNR